MAGKREMVTRDRIRAHSARKEKQKQLMARQKQQADVLNRLISQAKAEEKA